MSKAALRLAAKSLHEHIFRGLPNRYDVGNVMIGAHCIEVWFYDGRGAVDVPSEWGGYPVCVRENVGRAQVGVVS